jgi:hypothetical protein
MIKTYTRTLESGREREGQAIELFGVKNGLLEEGGAGLSACRGALAREMDAWHGERVVLSVSRLRWRCWVGGIYYENRRKTRIATVGVGLCYQAQSY